MWNRARETNGAQVRKEQSPESDLAACRQAADAAVFGALAIVRQAPQESPEKLAAPEFRELLVAVVRAALEG